MSSHRSATFGQAKQLLFDDVFITDRDGFVPTLNPAIRTGEPVLSPEPPWEERGCYAPTVLADGNGYRMWYGATGDDGISRLCCAVSADGVRWERPDIGLVTYGGRATNIVELDYADGPNREIIFSHHGSVFLDPVDRPERRYKMIFGGGEYGFASMSPGGARFRYEKTLPVRWRYPGVAGAYSADGLRWTIYDRHIMPWYTDTANVVFWDERLDRYVAYVRWNEYLRVVDGIQTGSFDYRAIGRTESADFENFPVPEKILEPDFSDPDDADQWGGGLYDSAALRYPFAADAYFFFIAAYHHTNDTLDIELATSRDGIRFTRWRQPFLRLGPTGAFDSKMLYMGVGLSADSGEIRQYYGGYDQLHDQASETQYQPAIGLARSRMDGFVSQDVGSSVGRLTTLPFTLEGNRLEINFDGSSRGWLKVELLDENFAAIPGFTEDKADRLAGNEVRRGVTWGGRADLTALMGRQLRLRFVGQSVKLYAFQFHLASN
ncbi:MAG: hypothetical protein FJY97_06920 [candidate division Zixibacteria bacterium]|nr:hypothetical protein [candidate division Zixibacteria bacterium]